MFSKKKRVKEREDIEEKEQNNIEDTTEIKIIKTKDEIEEKPGTEIAGILQDIKVLKSNSPHGVMGFFSRHGDLISAFTVMLLLAAMIYFSLCAC